MKTRTRRMLVILLLIVGVLVRCYAFGIVPSGLNCDEAFAGYEAYSLMTNGVDSYGNTNPCYLVAWGPGMNALESYLMIPFIRLLGLTRTAIRLPQLIVGCLSLWVFYGLLRRMFCDRTALIGLALLAICPWHIMLSRWGLESNLAPGLLLIGFYFVVRGLDDNRYWVCAAVAYGLSLYAYAITWLAVPMTLLAWAAVLLIVRRRVSLKWLLVSGAVLAALAMPLILFLMVNKGIIPEIRTTHFTIPKLTMMRDSEVSLRNLLSGSAYHALFKILVQENDGLPWNAMPEYGMFYRFSLPLIAVGGVRLAADAIKGLRKRQFCAEMLVLSGMMCSALLCLMIAKLNINKANNLHFYTLILLTLGVETVCTLLRWRRVVPCALLCAYTASFLSFSSMYFTAYPSIIAPFFQDGIGEAVTFTKERDFDSVCIVGRVYYPQILFYDQTPQEVYREAVEAAGPHEKNIAFSEMGRYTFVKNAANANAASAYILPKDQTQAFAQSGYTIQEFGEFAVAYH